jgi:Transposase DDE domain group 1
MSIDPWPSVTLTSTVRCVTAHSGAVLLRDVMGAVGLVSTVDATLGLKQRARGLSEGQFVASVAESIALGASCLDDLAVARADEGQELLRGFGVPAPQTAGTWLRRFTLGHICQLAKAMATVQRRAYELAGVKSVTLDFDSTYIFSRSKRRQGVDRTDKKGYALHPLLCFDGDSGAAVHARLRRGRVNTAAGMKTFLTEALRAVPEGVAVRARLDSGFYAGALFDQMESLGVTYLCGVPLGSEKMLEAIGQIPDDCWAPCVDKDEGEVAEFGYRLSASRRFRRYVVKRIEIGSGQQASLLTGGYRYWVLVTNDHTSSAPALESEHRHKANVEAGMRELKSNFGLSAARKHGFMVNWAWLLLVCLGHNLCCWLQQLGGLGAGRDGADLRAKRLRYRYLAVPGLVVRSGRALTLKLAEAYPHLERLLETRRRLAQLAIAKM